MVGLRINFILPDLFFGGGTRAVLEHAVNLRRWGHDVQVYVPRDGSLSIHRPVHSVYSLIRSRRDRRDFEWYGKDLIRIIPSIHDHFIQDGDVVIATWWKTAFPVHQLNPTKGKKVHFIQSDERIFDRRAFDAWRLPLLKITVAHHLHSTLTRLLRTRVYGPVTNCVNHDLFFQTPTHREREHTIGVQLSSHTFKGSDLAIRAFRRVRKAYPDARFLAVGQRFLPRIPSFLRYYYKPRQEEMREIYSRCAVWIIPSVHESMSLIPLEAAACGCTVIATETGDVHRYFERGKSFLQIPKGDVETMARVILGLVNDKETCQTISEEGKRRVQACSWTRSSKVLEGILKDILLPQQGTRRTKSSNDFLLRPL